MSASDLARGGGRASALLWLAAGLVLGWPSAFAQAQRPVVTDADIARAAKSQPVITDRDITALRKRIPGPRKPSWLACLFRRLRESMHFLNPSPSDVSTSALSREATKRWANQPRADQA